jgi:transcriptional regulator with XRE-family HTH domain
MKKWTDIKAKNMTPERRARLDHEVRAELLSMDLRELREMAGKTQAAVAEVAEMTQSELSRLERREDHRLSTLRKFVEALGGELEVIAVFGAKRVALAPTLVGEPRKTKPQPASQTKRA